MFCRGGKYSEEDAMAVVVQILSVVTYCYLQGVVHRDLKPEPGMVTTDLLLSGASTKQAKFFINVLVEPAEVRFAFGARRNRCLLED
ncbi:hypothetical protein CsSME_00049471 [Camellia sinensis var. sinensis]